jgi:hypothetical protein
VIENIHESKTETDSESRQLPISLLAFQHESLGADVVLLFNLERNFSDYHPFSYSRDLKWSTFPFHSEVSIEQPMAKCNFFQTKKALSAIAHKITPSVPVAIIRQSVSELEEAAVKITDWNFTGIFQSCKTVHLEELPRNF